MRRFTASLAAAGLAFSFAVAIVPQANAAVIANCSTWKNGELGGAKCSGSGGEFRARLDCPWSFDYQTDWYPLTSTPRSVTGSCNPYNVRNVTVETR